MELLVGSVQLDVACNLRLLLFCFITPRLVIGPENSRLFLGTLREILSKKQWRWFTVQLENFTSLFFSSMLFCLWRNEFFQLEMTAISVGTVQLGQFQFSIPGLLWFHSTLLCDWSRTPALFSQPIGFKTQNNRDLVTRVFPHLKHFSCFPISHWLMIMVTFSVNGRWNYFVLGFPTLSSKLLHTKGAAQYWFVDE